MFHYYNIFLRKSPYKEKRTRKKKERKVFFWFTVLEVSDDVWLAPLLLGLSQDSSKWQGACDNTKAFTSWLGTEKRKGLGSL
jgi:hypothetical protein